MFDVGARMEAWRHGFSFPEVVEVESPTNEMRLRGHAIGHKAHHSPNLVKARS
jgi:hypothetical protein